MDNEAKEILLKQMKLLQEESEKVRENGNLLDRPIVCIAIPKTIKANGSGAGFRTRRNEHGTR